MTQQRSVLVVGGGFSGMALAIMLRSYGMDVDLVEIDPSWRNYGAGITIGGAALRVCRRLGVLERVLEEGYCADHVDLFSPDGAKLGEVFTPRVAGPDVPGSGAIMRPALARILADATRAAGTNVRLGVTFETIRQDADGVDVLLSDASRGRYDLVVGADGLFSSVRRLIMPEAPQPTYVGQGVWRAVLPRPAEVTRTHMYLGPTTKVGFNPVSRAEMYVFVTEQRTQNVRVADTDLVEPLRGLLAEFSAPLVAAVRDQLSAGSSIVYRPLESLLVPAPWSRGRVVLIGDTVHATTPHLAAGAGMGIEDAVVLAEELAACTSVGESLARFQERRFERCRMVVENSRRLCEIEISAGSKQEHAQIMRNSMQALAVAI